MITLLREWLLALLTAAAVIALAETLAPEGTLRRVLHALGGMVLLVILLQPMREVDLSDLIPEPEAYRAAVEERRLELEEEQNSARRTVIAERTAAYIVDKARQMGLSCHAEVQVEAGEDGTLRPAAVALDCPFQADLSRYMEEILGISGERQNWDEMEGGRGETP